MKNEQNLYSVSEAARKLNRSIGWVRGEIKNRKIGHVRIGGRVYIPESAIEEIYEFVPRNIDK